MPEDGKEARKGPRSKMTADQRNARAMSSRAKGNPPRKGKLKYGSPLWKPKQ